MCKFSAVLLAVGISACANTMAADEEGGADAGRGLTPDADIAAGADGSSVQAADAAPELPACSVPGRAIVTDIDETLTTSDLEWLTQMVVGTYDPAERVGGAELIHEYATRGYFVLYLTSRPQTTNLGFTGESATDATRRWLEEHGYPLDPNRTRLQLAPDVVLGGASADYKSGALGDMIAEGFAFDFAYGNAASDIAAYEAVGIAKGSTYIIGPEAGTEGTVAIEGEGWTEHTATVLPGVPAVCRVDGP